MDSKGTRNKFIVMLIITNLFTFIFSNFIGLKLNRSTLIPKGEYNDLRDNYYRYSKVMELENYVKENYLREVDDNTLLEGQLKGLVNSLEDEYSTYLTVEEFSKLLEETSGSFGGIGVVVVPGEDGLITVVSPIQGSPGDRAGIIGGDKIVSVNGKSFNNDTMDEAVKEMKGEPGTEAIVGIVRNLGQSNQKDMKLFITREEIRKETVSSEILDSNIGYINIISFDEKTYTDFKRELDSLGSKGIKGLVLDLRYNPGGLLNIASQIADEFLDVGNIVYTQTRDGNREYIKSDSKKVDYPLVILVNGQSASASEVVAGAIKDRDRGKLIGTTTFGKGVVQRLESFPDGSGLKLTISEYFTPSGINIHGVGIKPDVEVENPEDISDIGPDNLAEDLQLQKAIKVIKEKIK